jgi:mRNA (2'-O-methyladenosine-N6-)-methyltransferase
MIENFCMGTRRLEICSNASNARPGWLTIGTQPAQQDSTAQIYDKQVFDAYFAAEASNTGSNLVPTTAEVESLRPRSPGPPGGANKGAANAGGSLIHGVKSNPQGIGRHTNRSATPSASQQLEMQQIQAQQMAEMERQRQFAEQQRLVHQQQQQQIQMQQQLQMQQQQQQWTMQQAQFMGMFQPGNNAMAMGMMPQMGMGMMGMPNPYAGMGMPFQQMQQFPQFQLQPQSFPQQQGFAGSIGQKQGGITGQYAYGHNQSNQQFQGHQQQ